MSIYRKTTINGFWKIDRTLTAHFKCLHTVAILNELIFADQKFADENGWFYYSVARLEEMFFIGEKARLTIFKKLTESGVLTLERRGIPCRYFYKINFEKIDEIIKNQDFIPPKAESSDPLEEVTGTPLEEVTGDPPKAVIIKKVFKNREEEGEEEIVPPSASSDLEEFKEHIDNCGFERLLAPKFISRLKHHYGTLDRFKNSIDTLDKVYQKKSPYKPYKADEWINDRKDFTVNAILKELCR